MKFRKSEYVDTPHGNSSVWRYMSHWKFERLLTDSALFFPNANKLSDQYEVTIPDSVLKAKRKELESSGLKGKELEEELAIFHWETNPMKDLVLANCWSISPYESYALWKIYLGGDKNGVAIRSTVSSLRASIQKGGDPYSEEFFIGKIRYQSHLKQDELTRLRVITTKKPFYDFEKELRVFIINYPLSEGGTVPPYDMNTGRSVKIDLATLVHNVYVSPFADSSYSRDVGTVLRKNKSRISVLKESEIRDR